MFWITPILLSMIFFVAIILIFTEENIRPMEPQRPKRCAAFWRQEPDAVVGNVLAEMLDSYEAVCELNGEQVDTPVLEKARGIIRRLTGKSSKTKPAKNP